MLADGTPADLLAHAPHRDETMPQLVKTTTLEDAFRHITLDQAGV
jgi:hypothetical protein